MSAGTKLTVLVLCPLTPLVHAWQRDPSIKQGIGQIVWMGGALKPTPDPGDAPTGTSTPVSLPGANPNAEWNAIPGRILLLGHGRDRVPGTAGAFSRPRSARSS